MSSQVSKARVRRRPGAGGLWTSDPRERRAARRQPPGWARRPGRGDWGGGGACAEPGWTQTLCYAQEVFTVRGAGLASRRLRPSEASPGPPRPRLLPRGTSAPDWQRRRGRM